MSWAELFERGAEHGATVETVRTALEARRDDG